MVAAVAGFDTGQLTRELTVAEAAEVLGVSQKTVRRYLSQGALIARDISTPASKRATCRIPLDAALDLRGAYAKQGETRRARASVARPAPYTLRNFTLLA